MKHDLSGFISKIGAIIVDNLGVVRAVDSAAGSIFGYSDGEIIGKDVTILLPEFYSFDNVEFFGGTQKQDKIRVITGSSEVFGHKKDGGTFPLWLAMTGVKLGGKQLFMVSVADLTGRKAAEKIHGQLAALIASSTDAIISKTLDGIVASWNPAAEQVFGYTEQDMIGQSMQLLIPSDRADEEAKILVKIRNGETVQHFETVRRRKDGTLVPISVTISPIKDASGSIIGASKIARDISDRQEVEEELRRYREHLEELVAIGVAEVNTIVQTAVSGMIALDGQGKIRVFNPAAEKLFGWTKDEVVGKNISILMQEPKSLLYEPALNGLQTGSKNQIATEREVRACRKDGSTFFANLAVGHAELPNSGHFVVGFITGISEHAVSEPAK